MFDFGFVGVFIRVSAFVDAAAFFLKWRRSLFAGAGFHFPGTVDSVEIIVKPVFYKRGRVEIFFTRATFGPIRFSHFGRKRALFVLFLLQLSLDPLRLLLFVPLPNLSPLGNVHFAHIIIRFSPILFLITPPFSGFFAKWLLLSAFLPQVCGCVYSRFALV